jgi:endonuclease-8
MPEGPSIVIAKEELKAFTGQKVIAASGLAKIDFDRLENQTITDIKSWGKHLLICFDGFTIRIHFMLFGKYLINERKETNPSLRLTFEDSELNFHTSSVKLLEGNVNDHYDWSEDLMNDAWDTKKAAEKLKEVPNKMVCDALLEQDIFSGLGNIIKNEVLYRARVHPESLVGKIPKAKTHELIEEARNYSFEFLKWKKEGVLKKNWLAHTKKVCTRCDLPIIKKYTGVKKRRSFYCENCQILHT